MKYASKLFGMFFGLTTLGLTSQLMAIERVSVSSSGEEGNNNSSRSSLSADGRFVAFGSFASNLVPGDSNGLTDIFINDTEAGTTERVSVSNTGEQSNGVSRSPSLSANGRYVAFHSSASNLVPGDTNGLTDIFIYDRETGTTERVNLSSIGEQSNNGVSSFTSLSADGRHVAFYSTASNLVPGDTNGHSDIFIHDRLTNTTERVSVSSTGEQGNGGSNFVTLSADGRFVTFGSNASNLVANDNNGVTDSFIHDRLTGTTERVSITSLGEQGNASSTPDSVSADGQLVTFTSRATNLVLNDTNGWEDVFIHDRATGKTNRLSVSSTGEQGNKGSGYSSVSADGQFVIFASHASNLVPGDTNGQGDVYTHDRVTGLTELVSVSFFGGQSNGGSFFPSLSADGRVIAFDSGASNLVHNDENNDVDVFVTNDFEYDLSTQLHPTSAAVGTGEYVRFRARLRNDSNQMLTGCRATIINQTNSSLGYGKLFSFYTWPLNVSNPAINQPMDIEPGQTVKMNLAVLARENYRGEVEFAYACDNARALTIPYVNTVHLVAKTEPLIAEDYVLLDTNGRSELVINQNSSKYWHQFLVRVKNFNDEPVSVNLTASSNLIGINRSLRKPQFCEPANSSTGDWSCVAPRSEQLQVGLAPNEVKKIRVFVHAYTSIDTKPEANIIYVEANDMAGETVSKTSMGVYTVN